MNKSDSAIIGEGALQGASTVEVANNFGAGGPSQGLPAPHTYGGLTASVEPGAPMEHQVGNIVSLTQPVLGGGEGRRRIDQPMADVDLSDALFRNVRVKDYRNFPNGYVDSFNPWPLWMANAFVADKLKNYQYLTGSMKIRGVFKAAPLASGLVVISAVPAADSALANAEIPAQMCMVVEHVLLDLSTSSDFELTVPWVYDSNWANKTEQAFLRCWTVTIRTLVGMKTAVPEGIPSASLQIYLVPGDDFKLSGVTYQSSRPPAIRSAQPSSKPKISQTLGLISKGAALVATFPSLAPAAGMVAAVAGASSKILDQFGYTREQVKEEPVVALVRPASNFLNYDGEDYSRMAALTSTNCISVDPGVSGSLSSVDETSLAFINSRYTLMGDLLFQVGAAGVEEYSIPVTPFMFASLSSGNVALPTTAGYVGARFKYWRGDMKYLFYPVVSPVHRGALQFVWQPTFLTPAGGTDFTNISMNSIVDVACAQPIEVNVGYNNSAPMCLQDFYSMSTPLSPSDSQTLNGYLRVKASAPFTGSVPGEVIRVLVFVAAGENMEFGCPTDVTLFEGEPLVIGSDFDVQTYLHSGVVGADGQDSQSVSLVPSSGTYPIEENLMGEKISSVRALIQKPSLAAYMPNINDSDARNGVIPMSHSPRLWLCSNYFDYYGSMFLGFAGAIRYKALVDVTRSQSTSALSPWGSVSYSTALTPAFSTSDAIFGSAPTVEVAPVLNPPVLATEYTVPYYHRKLYVPAYKANSVRRDVMTFPATPVVSSETGIKARVNMALYRSAAPDARLVFFRAQNVFSFLPVAAPISRMGPKVSTLFSDLELIKWNTPVPSALLREGGEGLEEEQTLDAVSVPITVPAGEDYKNLLTLSEYEARTGRVAYKYPLVRRTRVPYVGPE